MKISPTDSLIYYRIKFFTEKGDFKCCSQNNHGLASHFCIAKETVSRSISKLKKTGYVKELQNLAFRALVITDKKFVFNYHVNTDDKSVIVDDNMINVNDKAVMLRSLLDDKSVIVAMINRSLLDDKSVNHKIEYNTRLIIKELNKKKTITNVISKKVISEYFEKFYPLYPLKKGKKDGSIKFFAYFKGLSREEASKLFGEMMAGLKSYCDEIKGKRIETKYIQHFSTFMNKKSWQDEYGTRIVHKTASDVFSNFSSKQNDERIDNRIES